MPTSFVRARRRSDKMNPAPFDHVGQLSSRSLADIVPRVASRQISMHIDGVRAYNLNCSMRRITEDFSFNIQDALMDAISENISKKRRRGRPPIAVVEGDPRNVSRSRRSLIDRTYGSHALAVIGNGEEPDLTWLADAQAGRYRRTVLAELGRFDDDDLLLDVAFEVCALKLKTVPAVRLIRARRHVLKPASLSELESEDGMTQALRETINRWRAANPSGTWEDVHHALQWLVAAVGATMKRRRAAGRFGF